MLHGSIQKGRGRSHGMFRFAAFAFIALASAFAGLGSAPDPARANLPQTSVVVIDSTTTLPVGTNIYAPSNAGDIIVLAEGTLRGPVLGERFEQGWFGPAGQDHYEAADQLIHDGMPYGALIGGFHDNPVGYQFLGRMAAFALQPADVGKEFRLGLNLSAADLATLDGQITVTVIFLPPESRDVSSFVINPGTPLPLGTGMIAEAGDQFIVLPHGRFRDPLLANSAYSDGNFGPEGLLGVITATQPHIDGPYGALYGNFSFAGVDFYIGDGGCFTAQPTDIGSDLSLILNADAASQAGMFGKFVVTVVRVPEPDPANVEPAEAGAGARVAAFPNPARGSTSIAFRLAAAERARLRVYDANGRQMRSLIDETLPAGPHSVVWNGEDASGRRLPAGPYFYQLSTRAGTETGRVVLVD